MLIRVLSWIFLLLRRGEPAFQESGLVNRFEDACLFESLMAGFFPQTLQWFFSTESARCLTFVVRPFSLDPLAVLIRYVCIALRFVSGQPRFRSPVCADFGPPPASLSMFPGRKPPVLEVPLPNPAAWPYPFMLVYKTNQTAVYLKGNVYAPRVPKPFAYRIDRQLLSLPNKQRTLTLSPRVIHVRHFSTSTSLAKN